MPCTLHAAWWGRKFRVLGQGPWSGPAFLQKARQISIFCVYAPFIFHLIIARFGASFLSAGRVLFGLHFVPFRGQNPGPNRRTSGKLKFAVQTVAFRQETPCQS